MHLFGFRTASLLPFRSTLWWFCIFTGIHSFPANAQNNPIPDTLIQILRLNKPDSIKVKMIINFGIGIRTTNPNLGVRIADSCISWCSRSPFQNQYGRAFQLKASVRERQGQYEEADSLYDRAIDQFKSSKNMMNIAHCLIGQANCYLAQNHLNLAAYKAREAVEVASEIKDSVGISSGLGVLVFVNIALKNFDYAILKSRELLAMRRGSPPLRLDYFSTYNELGAIYLEAGALDSALFYFQIAKDSLAGDSASLYIYGQAVGNIGAVYVKMKDYGKARPYLMESIRLCAAIQDSMGIGVGYLNMAGMLMEQKEYVKALEYSNMSLSLAKSFGDRDSELLNYKTIAEIYYQQGRFRDAFDYYDLYVLLQDSIRKSSDLAKIDNEEKLLLSSLAEKERLESENSTLLLNQVQQKRKVSILINIILAVSTFLIGCLAFLLFAGLKRIKMMKDSAYHQIKQNLSLLRSIVDYYLNAEKPLSHGELHQILESRITALRDIQNYGGGKYFLRSIPVNAIAKKLADNYQTLVPNSVISVKGGENIQVHPSKASYIGMIISEMLANTTKHAVTEGQVLLVQIEFSKDTTDGIMIRIRDNGPGFASKAPPMSTGWKVINMLVHELRGSIEFFNDNGAVIQLRFFNI